MQSTTTKPGYARFGDYLVSVVFPSSAKRYHYLYRSYLPPGSTAIVVTPSSGPTSVQVVGSDPAPEGVSAKRIKSVTHVAARKVGIDPLLSADYGKSAKITGTRVHSMFADDLVAHDRRDWAHMFHDAITQTSKHKAPETMNIKIENKTFVNGTDVANLTPEQVFDIIQKAEREVDRLHGTRSKPVMLQKRIDDLNTGIASLVTLLDERDTKAEFRFPVDPA